MCCYVLTDNTIMIKSRRHVERKQKVSEKNQI